MHKNENRDDLLERRLKSNRNSQWWDELTLSQKFSASCMAKYDYELAFIRRSSSGSYAVLIRGEESVSISSNGDINTSTNLYIRNKSNTG